MCLKENRIYVTCQTDDDLDQVLTYAGEDNLVIGTDYGHADNAAEIEALRKLRNDGQIAGSSDRQDSRRQSAGAVRFVRIGRGVE